MDRCFPRQRSSCVGNGRSRNQLIPRAYRFVVITIEAGISNTLDRSLAGRKCCCFAGSPCIQGLVGSSRKGCVRLCEWSRCSITCIFIWDPLMCRSSFSRGCWTVCHHCCATWWCCSPPYSSELSRIVEAPTTHTRNVGQRTFERWYPSIYRPGKNGLGTTMASWVYVIGENVGKIKTVLSETYPIRKITATLRERSTCWWRHNNVSTEKSDHRTRKWLPDLTVLSEYDYFVQWARTKSSYWLHWWDDYDLWQSCHWWWGVFRSYCKVTWNWGQWQRYFWSVSRV